MTVSELLMIQKLEGQQRGVFTRPDLEAVFGTHSPSAVANRVRALQTAGILKPFRRGIYATGRADIATISQTLAPDSVVSMTRVLSDALVIGTAPQNVVEAIRVTTRTRHYTGADFRISHHAISANLLVDFKVKNGVKFASPEKAVLDALYFHQRGKKFVFDIYSDLNLSRLDQNQLKRLLSIYKNPKFRAFARNVLKLDS